MQQFNWVNKLTSLIVPFMGGSIAGVFLLRQFMATIPVELEEAAFLDGCSRLKIFFKIILPLTLPALLTLGVILFNTSWNNFIWPLLMIREKTNATLPLGLSYYMPSGETDMGKNFDWGVLMSATIIAVLPSVIIYIFVQKQFVRGITLSGLKS
jgi:multiple sugar transport system permease protein